MVFQELLDRTFVEERLELPRKRVGCGIRSPILYDIRVKQYWRVDCLPHDVEGSVYPKGVGCMLEIASTATTLTETLNERVDFKNLTGQ